MSVSLAYDEDLLQLAANIGINTESLKNNLEAIDNIQEEKNFIDDKIFTGEIQQAIDNIAKNDVNKLINDLAREVAERKGLNFISYDERMQLLEEGFSEEEIDN